MLLALTTELSSLTFTFNFFSTPNEIRTRNLSLDAFLEPYPTASGDLGWRRENRLGQSPEGDGIFTKDW